MSRQDLTPEAIEVSTTPAAALPRKQRKTDWAEILSLRQMGVYYALIILVDVLSLATLYLGHPNYLSALNITNVFYQASLTSIMAVAMTVVLISGNFDLSVASVAALAAAVLTGFADSIGFWPAAGLALAVSAGVGLINGAIVQFVGINAFIVTLATMTAVRGVVLIYTDGHSLAVQSPAAIEAMKAFESGQLNIGLVAMGGGALLLAAGLAHLLRHRASSERVTPFNAALIGAGIGALVLAAAGGGRLMLPKPVVYMAAFTLLVWFILQFTVVGRRLYAVGGNPEAARLSGINVTRYRLTAFVLCSLAAGFAGILFASRLRSINPAALTGAELTVIAAAILGGTSLFGGAGSVIKTVAGALLLYSLTNGFNILNLGANYQGLIAGIVLVAAASIYTVGGDRRRSKSS